MSLSTKKYATQVVLDSCVAAKHCNISSELLEPYARNASTSAVNGDIDSYSFKQYSPVKDVLALSIKDTIGFPFIQYDQISILK